MFPGNRPGAQKMHAFLTRLLVGTKFQHSEGLLEVVSVYVNDDEIGNEVFPMNWGVTTVHTNGKAGPTVWLPQVTSAKNYAGEFIRAFGKTDVALLEQQNPYVLTPSGLARLESNLTVAVAIQEHPLYMSFWLDWGASQRLAQTYVTLAATFVGEVSQFEIGYRRALDFLHSLTKSDFYLYQRGYPAELPEIESDWLHRISPNISRLNTSEFASMVYVPPTLEEHPDNPDAQVVTTGKMVFKKT